ncbi:MAG: amino-acid N-acetyltransferase, partial [Gammaproteobacteria bacterium]|nr:amino-acid N-acetyltransferase [Gammaproteobacteria bacterium]
MADSPVSWFREASPYIEAHRGKTFVIYVSGEAIDHGNSDLLINDIARLASLGIHLVVVHGARPQISAGLTSASQWHDGIRITPAEDMEKIQQIVGGLSTRLQSRLSAGSGLWTHSKGHRQVVVCGNFITARPVGVIDGVDYQRTGQVRHIHLDALRQQLEANNIVLVSPQAHSPSGEIFNISSQDLAFQLAIGLVADKLIYYIEGKGIMAPDGLVTSEMQPGMMHQTDFSDGSGNKGLESILEYAGEACLKGVNRCHLISYTEDGALLKELFTRDGTGTQISRHSYEKVRA